MQHSPTRAIRDAAAIVRTFIEDYHEKLEEDYLFPGFEEARTPSSRNMNSMRSWKTSRRRQHQLFGEDGFEKRVDRIAGIEKRLDIYDLAKFTPRV